MDKVEKSAQVSKLEVSEDELVKINGLALRELTADDVFTFKVAICDNEVDRDFEYFTSATLEQLSKLFVGKTVISDHNWKSSGQVARIYSTEVADGDGSTQYGEGYKQLVAHCYMVRNDSTKDMIDAIESGILKEVSIGCSIKSAVCSVCGLDNRESYCKHLPGREYDNKMCCFALDGAKDAYELSFVAVPAQKNAGVIKSYGDKPFDPAENEPEEKQDELPEDIANKVLTLELEGVSAFIFTKKHKFMEETK